MEVCYEPIVNSVQAEDEPVMSASKTYTYPLLRNVHLALPLPQSAKPTATVLAACSTYLTRGNFSYFHYQCDGFPDSGWGCAYRTLQSAASWILDCRARAAQQSSVMSDIDMVDDEQDTAALAQQVPSVLEIQQALVRIGDKPADFVGSHAWIGALEVFYVIDTLYNVPCKILHIPKREDLKKYANVLKKYFEDFGGFVMMGGDVDAASKGIAGIHISGNQAYFLVVDSHFVGKPKSAQELIERGYIRWQHTSEFVDSSFYNLCLPQLK